MNKLIERIAQKISKMNYREIRNFMRRMGYYNESGCYKTVFTSPGSEFVIKIISKEIEDSENDREIIDREIGGFYQNIQNFKPKTFLELNGECFYVVVQEKVNIGFSDQEFFRARRRLKNRLEWFGTTDLYFMDAHRGNFGIDKSGKGVFFDGV